MNINEFKFKMLMVVMLIENKGLSEQEAKECMQSLIKELKKS